MRNQAFFAHGTQTNHVLDSDLAENGREGLGDAAGDWRAFWIVARVSIQFEDEKAETQ